MASTASANATEEASCTNCAHNAGAVHDIEDIGTFMTTDRRMISRRVLDALAARKEYTGLEGFMFSDPEVYKADLEHIFHKEWVFAGHDIEIPEVGQWLSLQVGDFPVVIVRGKDEKVHAYHNVCRHRGSKVVGGVGRGTHWHADVQKPVLPVPQMAIRHRHRQTALRARDVGRL